MYTGFALPVVANALELKAFLSEHDTESFFKEVPTLTSAYYSQRRHECCHPGIASTELLKQGRVLLQSVSLQPLSASLQNHFIPRKRVRTAELGHMWLPSLGDS